MQLKYTITHGQLAPANSCSEAWTQKREGLAVTMEPLSPAKVRSLECNAKYWAWVRQVADDKGYSSAYVHNYHKYYFGMAIAAEQNPEKYHELRRAMMVMNREQRISFMDIIVCTSDFNQDQMNRFMETVQRHWAEQGIILD